MLCLYTMTSGKCYVPLFQCVPFPLLWFPFLQNLYRLMLITFGISPLTNTNSCCYTVSDVLKNCMLHRSNHELYLDEKKLIPWPWSMHATLDALIFRIALLLQSRWWNSVFCYRITFKLILPWWYHLIAIFLIARQAILKEAIASRC